LGINYCKSKATELRDFKPIQCYKTGNGSARLIERFCYIAQYRHFAEEYRR